MLPLGQNTMTMSLQISQALLASLDEMGVQIDTDRELELVDGGTLVINYEALRPDGERHTKFRRFGIKLLPPKFVVEEFGKDQDLDFIMVGRQIRDDLKQGLRNAHSPYLDLGTDELFLALPDLRLWLNSKPKVKKQPLVETERLPSGTDLRLFMVILSDPPHTLSLPLRNLALLAGISLGSTSNGLRQHQKFVGLLKVIPEGEQVRMSELLPSIKSFAIAYNKWFRSESEPINRFDRKTDELPDNTQDYCFSGGAMAQELGLDIYSPELIIYTSKTLSETMRLFKLVPSTTGMARVFFRHWKPEIDQSAVLGNSLRLAPWLVFFADLLASEDVRVQGLFEAGVERYIEMLSKQKPHQLQYI